MFNKWWHSTGFFQWKTLQYNTRDISEGTSLFFIFWRCHFKVVFTITSVLISSGCSFAPCSFYLSFFFFLLLLWSSTLIVHSQTFFVMYRNNPLLYLMLRNVPFWKKGDFQNFVSISSSVSISKNLCKKNVCKSDFKLTLNLWLETDRLIVCVVCLIYVFKWNIVYW